MPATPLRKEYRRADLDEADLRPDPVDQFQVWFDDAQAAAVPEPNAMTLATASPEGRPSARVVLLKAFDARGFVFYTNDRGRKGRELDANPFAALAFFWPTLERQVRIEGRVTRADAAESDAYYASRPRSSRLGAWASEQGAVIPDRATLEARMRDLEREFAGEAIPRPPHWGGYRVAPDSIEFWQGRPDRLHDRLRYRRDAEGLWRIERLAP